MGKKNFSSVILYSILKKICSIDENDTKELGSVKRILVVRQHNQFGDMLAGVSLFRAIKEKYPESRLTVIASPENYIGVIKNSFVDDVIVFDKTKIYNPFHFFNFIKKIRSGFDVAIAPATVSISFTSGFISRISRSRIRIGPNSLDGIPNPGSFLFDRRVDLDWRKYPDSNVAEHILEIIKPFGFDTKDISSQISIEQSDIHEAKKYSNKINPDNKLLIGFHVGAGKPPNRWSLSKYSELISILASSYNCVFYLTGTDADIEEVNFVCTNSKESINTFLNKPMTQVAALISISDLFITNDTGIMHVAGTTATPQISLFGPTNPFNWAPCGKNKIFLRKSDLIDDIEVEDVFEICKLLLNKADGQEK